MVCKFRDGFLTVEQENEEEKLVLIFEHLKVVIEGTAMPKYIAKNVRDEIKNTLQFVEGVRFAKFIKPRSIIIERILMQYMTQYKGKTIYRWLKELLKK